MLQERYCSPPLPSRSSSPLTPTSTLLPIFPSYDPTFVTSVDPPTPNQPSPSMPISSLTRSPNPSPAFVPPPPSPTSPMPSNFSVHNATVYYVGFALPQPLFYYVELPPPLYPVAADPVSLGCLATGCFSTGLLHHLLQHNIYLLPSISFCLSNRLVCLVVKPSSVRPYAVVCALLLSLNVISWNEK